MTAMVLAPFAAGPVKFTHLERLRAQECERVAAMRAELTKCGVRVVERGQSLDDFPGGGKTARGGNRDLQRSPRGDVFCHSGIESRGHQTQESRLREKDISQFFPKAGRAVRPGGLGAVIIDARRAGGGWPAADLFAD